MLKRWCASQCWPRAPRETARLSAAGARASWQDDAAWGGDRLYRRMKTAAGEGTRNPRRHSSFTHEHQDHINILPVVTARKLGIPVYFTDATHRAWMRWLTPRRQMTYAQWLELCRKQAAEREAEPAVTDAECLAVADSDVDPESPSAELAGPEGADGSAPSAQAVGLLNLPVESDPAIPPTLKQDPTWLPAVEYFQAGQPLTIGDIGLSPFTTPHDAADPVGFVFSAEGVRMGFATDLGYIPPPTSKQQLRNTSTCSFSNPTTTWRCCAMALTRGQ